MQTELPATRGVSIIAALARNNAIGIENRLPWHIPADLKFFKRVTLGKPVVMGRKTYESIGKPLPGRLNVVITRDRRFSPDGVTVVHSLEEAVRLGKQQSEEVMVIGGADIYRQALVMADNLYLTEVDLVVDGDAFFPPFNKAEWTPVWQDSHPQSETNPQAFRFVCYQR